MRVEQTPLKDCFIVHEKVNGIRVTPNVYTQTQDLDFLVKGLREISAAEPPTGK